MEAIRSELARLKELETELSQSKWNTNDASSPRGLVDNDNQQQQHGHSDATALIQRYEQARDLYLQRRLENLLVDHIATFEDGQFDYPHGNEDDEGQAIQERHQQALATLEGSMEKIASQVEQLRATREAVASRRQELEQMIQDMEDDNVNDDNDISMLEDDTETIGETEMASEQERIEQLQKQKRKLEDELASIQQETREAEERTRSKQETLKQQQLLFRQEKGEDSPEQLQKKVDELREIKVFYDSLREVLEELGGVKISKVEEEPVQRHLILTLVFYEEYQVQVELEVYRKVFLKLVRAKWLSSPVVRPNMEDETDASPNNDSKNKEDFFLTMDPLDDLVQVAKTTLGPPHDLRFVVREALARIRIFQDRVEELAVLRRHVLTKIHNGNQLVCSLNQGIVIVIRLYERFIRLDQIVGVGGWDEDVTQKIQTDVVKRLETEYPQDDMDVMLRGSKVTPLIIVQCVEDELEQLEKASNGWTNPVTPRFPERKGQHKGGF